MKKYIRRCVIALCIAAILFIVIFSFRLRAVGGIVDLNALQATSLMEIDIESCLCPEPKNFARPRLVRYHYIYPHDIHWHGSIELTHSQTEELLTILSGARARPHVTAHPLLLRGFFFRSFPQECAPDIMIRFMLANEKGEYLEQSVYIQLWGSRYISIVERSLFTPAVNRARSGVQLYRLHTTSVDMRYRILDILDPLAQYTQD